MHVFTYLYYLIKYHLCSYVHFKVGKYFYWQVVIALCE